LFDQIVSKQLRDEQAQLQTILMRSVDEQPWQNSFKTNVHMLFQQNTDCNDILKTNFIAVHLHNIRNTKWCEITELYNKKLDNAMQNEVVMQSDKGQNMFFQESCLVWHCLHNTFNLPSMMRHNRMLHCTSWHCLQHWLTSKTVVVFINDGLSICSCSRLRLLPTLTHCKGTLLKCHHSTPQLASQCCSQSARQEYATGR